MMGPRQEAPAELLHEISRWKIMFPGDHLPQPIDRVVDLGSIRAYLADFHSHTARPSVDCELAILMLPVGYCLGVGRTGGSAKRGI